ncbi:centrosomal of 85 kDa [Schistosoma japonicum]|nr:centrosomal of 85 kDa [Schistosoma japonicum]KAH8858514.1 centrosomal of 85 kDa [Schistosoma japonicum]KAH8858515.1 centrosomal of 85 kDa [Schistosoma japonicum]KAH8858516.1 centrosomal of 85 kDa [Schistosoma japonicum]
MLMSNILSRFNVMNNEGVHSSKPNSCNILLATCQPMSSDDYLSENKALKLKLLELSTLLQRDRTYFNQRLGATEYELEQCKKANEDLTNQQNVKIHKLQNEIETYRNHLAALKIDLEQSKQTIELKQEKIDQMELYLAKLPTFEDYQETLNKFQLVKNQCSLLEKSVEEYKNKLKECDMQLDDSNIQIKQYKEREQLLQAQLDAALERLNKNKAERYNNLEAPKVMPIFVEDLKFELERYRVAFEQTKKLLEAETCRAEASETHQKLEQRKMNEYHARIEAEMTGIKASLSARRDEIQQLKKRISKITIEKQELLSNVFEAHHALMHMISLWKSTNGQLCHRLYEYIQENVNEIVRLSKQLNNLANGERLHLSELLIQPKPLLLDATELKDNDDDDDDAVFHVSCSPLVERDCLKHQDNNNNGGGDSCGDKNSWEASFHNVMNMASQLTNNVNREQLHTSLDQLIKTRSLLLKLRQELANKYADHLGGKINCVVQ